MFVILWMHVSYDLWPIFHSQVVFAEMNEDFLGFTSIENLCCLWKVYAQLCVRIIKLYKLYHNSTYEMWAWGSWLTLIASAHHTSFDILCAHICPVVTCRQVVVFCFFNKWLCGLSFMRFRVPWLFHFGSFELKEVNFEYAILDI